MQILRLVLNGLCLTHAPFQIIQPKRQKDIQKINLFKLKEYRNKHSSLFFKLYFSRS